MSDIKRFSKEHDTGVSDLLARRYGRAVSRAVNLTIDRTGSVRRISGISPVKPDRDGTVTRIIVYVLAVLSDRNLIFDPVVTGIHRAASRHKITSLS